MISNYKMLIVILFSGMLFNSNASGINDKLGFIKNEGQISKESILFYNHQQGIQLSIDHEGSINYQVSVNDHHFTNGHNVKIKFSNANKVNPKGWKSEPKQITYFNGKNEITTISYEKLILEDLYHNIDLIYYSDASGNFKYDFLVHPGGKPSDIVINYSGQNNLQTHNGELIITTSLGNINEGLPYSYSENGLEVSNNYLISDNNTIRFNVGEYDKTQDLIIDPSVQWSTVLGGDVNDFIEASKVDSEGNVYLTGYTGSKDDLLPFTTGAFQVAPNALTDAYIAKLDGEGNLLWASFYGGDDNDYANGIALDSDNNVYITGSTESLDFPTSANGFNTNQGGGELFVLKFAPDGTRLFAGLYGGASGDVGEKIVVTSSNEVFVVGSTSSEFFPSGNPISGTGDDAIIMKLKSDLSGYVWSKYIGGATGDQGFGLGIDSEGDVIITGRTSSETGFPITSTAHQQNSAGKQEAFVTKLSGVSGELLYSSYLGGNEDDWGADIVIDNQNNFYVIGYTSSTNFPTQNGFQDTYQGGVSDGFVAKFNSSGLLQWSTYLGGSGTDELNAGIVYQIHFILLEQLKALISPLKTLFNLSMLVVLIWYGQVLMITESLFSLRIGEVKTMISVMISLQTQTQLRWYLLERLPALK